MRANDATRVIETETRYDPTFFTNVQFQHQNQQLAFQQAGAVGNILNQSIANAQVGVRQALQGGGTIELRNETAYTHVPGGSPGVNPNPFWTNQVVAEITQPVLGDSGNQINRARITIARNTQRISLLEFRKQLEETIADAEKTDWQ